MESIKQYRRAALKLIARARIRGKRAEPLLRGAASLAAVAAAGAVVWSLLGFARVGLAGGGHPQSRPATPAAEVVAPNDVVTNAGTGTLAKRECLVYVTEEDGSFYHASVHTAHESQRQAIGIDLARTKGLAPCPVCFRGKDRGVRAVISKGTGHAGR